MKDDRLQQLHAELTAGVESLASSEQWAAMLATAARFHKYSFGNVLLIMRQCPTATRVAGFQAWKALGRSVRKGEKALWILAPCRYKVADRETGEERWVVRGFKAVPVFDLAQTDGEDLADVRAVLVDGGAPAGLWDGLAKQVAAAGFMLTRADDLGGANGVTRFDTREVVVRADVSDAQACKTLAHELGHILLGHESELLAGDPEQGRREVEAESVAFIVAGALGMATDGYSMPYVARWAAGDAEQVKRSAERVLKVAGQMIDALSED
jgi:antirestriction protein ArdC